ncbi:MAG: hypothetical protein Q8M83_03460 [bacterium]|nr:hypothetical protein [bacterium]
MTSQTENGQVCGALSPQKKDLQENVFLNAEEKWQRIRTEVLNTSDSERAERFALCLNDIFDSEALLTREKIWKMFCFEIQQAQKDLHLTLKEYCPSKWYSALTPKTRLPNDPVLLLEYWQKVGPKNKSPERETFEILRLMEVAFRYLTITLSFKHGRKDSTRAALNRFLRKRKIILQRPRRVSTIFFYNPDDDYRFTEIGLPFNQVLQLWPSITLNVVIIQLNAPGSLNPVHAIMEIRKKNHFQILAKMFREQSQNPNRVPDRYGIRFAYFDPNDMKQGQDLISENLSSGTNLVRNVSGLNPHSDQTLRIETQYALLAGRYREIQHMPLQNWFDIHHSISPANYRRYHRRWSTALDPMGIFHLLWPFEIFRTPWETPEVFEEMDEHIRKMALARYR